MDFLQSTNLAEFICCCVVICANVDWYYTNYLQALIGVDSFNPFIVTTIPPKLKDSNRLPFPAHLSWQIPCAQTPLTDLEWTKERKKGERDGRKDTWVFLMVSDMTGKLCCKDSSAFHLLVFCFSSEKIESILLSFILFSYLSHSYLTPSFMSYKKKKKFIL